MPIWAVLGPLGRAVDARRTRGASAVEKFACDFGRLGGLKGHGGDERVERLARGSLQRRALRGAACGLPGAGGDRAHALGGGQPPGWGASWVARAQVGGAMTGSRALTR